MTPETARKTPRNGTCTGSIAAQFREALRLPVEKAGDNAILPECFPHLFNMESCLYSGIFTGFPPFPPSYYYDYYSNKPYALGVRARLRPSQEAFFSCAPADEWMKGALEMAMAKRPATAICRMRCKISHIAQGKAMRNALRTTLHAMSCAAMKCTYARHQQHSARRHEPSFGMPFFKNAKMPGRKISAPRH